MDLARIEGLIELAARSPVAELEYCEQGWRVRLAKADPEVPVTRAPVDHAPSARAEASPVPPAVEEAHLIVAGLAGTFHRRPAPGQPAFVDVGDHVEDGQRIGILEAMKTLIGVDADRAGRIGQIFCEDGSPVRPGEPLFAIVPAGRP